MVETLREMGAAPATGGTFETVEEMVDLEFESRISGSSFKVVSIAIYAWNARCAVPLNSGLRAIKERAAPEAVADQRQGRPEDQGDVVVAERLDGPHPEVVPG